MSDLRDALFTICELCNDSGKYTRRIKNIHEAAMKGLGMVEKQRQDRHCAIIRAVQKRNAEELVAVCDEPIFEEEKA